MTIKELKKELKRMTEEETYKKAKVLFYDKVNDEIFTPDEVYCNTNGNVVIAGTKEEYI